MTATINVGRILRGMAEKGWGKRDTCVMCHVNNKTLANVLDGKVPQRLDALYRLCKGLKIPIEEAIVATTPQEEKRSRFHLVLGGRQPGQVS